MSINEEYETTISHQGKYRPILKPFTWDEHVVSVLFLFYLGQGAQFRGFNPTPTTSSLHSERLSCCNIDVSVTVVARFRQYLSLARMYIHVYGQLTLKTVLYHTLC